MKVEGRGGKVRGPKLVLGTGPLLMCAECGVWVAGIIQRAIWSLDILSFKHCNSFESQVRHILLPSFWVRWSTFVGSLMYSLRRVSWFKWSEQSDLPVSQLAYHQHLIVSRSVMGPPFSPISGTDPIIKHTAIVYSLQHRPQSQNLLEGIHLSDGQNINMIWGKGFELPTIICG